MSLNSELSFSELPTKAEQSYLIHSWGKNRWNLTFLRNVSAKVNVTNSTEIRTRIADFSLRDTIYVTTRTYGLY